MISATAVLDHFRIKIFRAYADISPWKSDDPWQTLYDRCESPIEKMMCDGIHTFLGYEAVSGDYFAAGFDHRRRIAAYVFGQQVIDRSRADFLVVAVIRGRFPTGIVVECDGAQFHDSLRDQQRDAHLLRLGFPTVRFTGREIHRDLPVEIFRIPAAFGPDIEDALATEYGHTTLAATRAEQRLRRPPANDPDAASSFTEDGFEGNWKDTI